MARGGAALKAITLWQPWASLVAAGVKRNETRSWATSYRGPLAIHAAKCTPAWVWELINKDPDLRELMSRAFGHHDVAKLPSGVLLCTTDLWACVPVDEMAIGELSETEKLCGNYSSGRFAWCLKDAKPLPEPIPARGRQGLWEWQP